MKEEIIKKYLNGYSISKLLIEYPSFNRRQINKLLKENNITIRGGRKKREWSLEQKEELKEKDEKEIEIIEKTKILLEKMSLNFEIEIKKLKEKLELELNQKTQIFKNKQGVNFCGYKINEYRLKIRDRRKKKIKK